MRGKILSAVVLLAASTVSIASSRPEQPKPVFGETVATSEFPALIEMVRDEIKPGGRWEYVPERDRPKLETQMKRMQDLIAGHPDVDAMSDADKSKLMNAQSSVNAILTRHDGKRLICERHKPTGSHRTETICITYAKRQAMRENSQQALQKMQSGRTLEPRG